MEAHARCNKGEDFPVYYKQYSTNTPITTLSKLNILNMLIEVLIFLPLTGHLVERKTLFSLHEIGTFCWFLPSFSPIHPHSHAISHLLCFQFLILFQLRLNMWPDRVFHVPFTVVGINIFTNTNTRVCVWFILSSFLLHFRILSLFQKVIKNKKYALTKRQYLAF